MIFDSPDKTERKSPLPATVERLDEQVEYFPPTLEQADVVSDYSVDTPDDSDSSRSGEAVVASGNSIFGAEPVFESDVEPRASLLGRMATGVKRTIGSISSLESDTDTEEISDESSTDLFEEGAAEDVYDDIEYDVDVVGEPWFPEPEEQATANNSIVEYNQGSNDVAVPIFAALNGKIQTFRDDRKLGKKEREQTKAAELAEAEQRRQQDRLAVEIAETEAQRTRTEAKQFQDLQTQSRIGEAIEQTAGLFNRKSLIEQPEHLRLPNPRAINRYVWGEVGLSLAKVTEEIDTRHQLQAVARKARSDAERLLPESAPIMSEEYQRAVQDYEMQIVDTVEKTLDQLLLDATEKVYVNPFPEDGRSHREYAFDLAAQTVEIQPTEMDQLVQTRDTVVFATLVVDEETDNYVFGDIDGVSKLLDRCSTSLENVDPQCRDKRVSGLLVKRPGEDYAGGIAIEVRYDGIKPLESEDLDRPAYVAQFVVEARHVQPDVFSSLEQEKLHNYSEAGRRDPIDIRVLPLFEAHAIRNGAQPKFAHYAETVAQALAEARDAKSMRLSAGGYSTDWSKIGSIGPAPSQGVPAQPKSALPPPPPPQLSRGYEGTVIDVTDA